MLSCFVACAETQPVADELLVSWDVVTYAEQYHAQYCSGVCTTQNWTEHGSMTTTTNSAIIDNLTPATTYSFRVSAQATKQDNTPVQSIHTPIVSQTVPLLLPAGLALSVNNTTINALWTPVTGATAYDVWYCTGTCTSDSDWTKNTTTTTRYSITNVTPNTTYQVRVRGTHSTVQGPFSQQQASSNLLQIAGLAAFSPEDTSFDLSWDSVSNATGYTISHRHRIPDGQDSAWSSPTNISTTTNSAQLTSLYPGARYEVLVTALNGSSPIAQSSPLITNTTPSQIIGVSTTPNETEITVTYTAFTPQVTPAGSIQYDVRYRTGSNIWTQINSASQTTQITITSSQTHPTPGLLYTSPSPRD